MKDNTNKKRLGCFKDELNGQVMSEIVAPSPKCYAYKYAGISIIDTTINDSNDLSNPTFN